MWTQIGNDDQVGLQNFVLIMQQMDARYGSLQVSDVWSVLREIPSEAWHYQGNGFEIVMFFQYSAQRAQWQITYLGFVGVVQPSDVLAQVIDRGQVFMQDHGVPFLYAFRPSTIGFAPLGQLYDLVPMSPLLQVTVVRQATDGTFWQIEYIGPPLGDMESAGRWLHVTCDDPGLVRRFLAVMNQMGDEYRRETVQLFNSWVGHRLEALGGAYYYWLPDSELVVRFVYSFQRKQFEVLSVGLVGALAPAAALDLVVEKAIAFARNNGQHSVSARRPRRMKSEAIMQLHDLVPCHPRIRVTVEKEVPSGVRWKIVAPELVTQ